MNTRTRTHYAVLGVSFDANLKEIKQAYRKKMLEFHPDLNSDPKCQKESRAINAAHEILEDPIKRKQYDLAVTNQLSNIRDLDQKLYICIKSKLDIISAELKLIISILDSNKNINNNTLCQTDLMFTMDILLKKIEKLLKDAEKDNTSLFPVLMLIVFDKRISTLFPYFKVATKTIQDLLFINPLMPPNYSDLISDYKKQTLKFREILAKDSLFIEIDGIIEKSIIYAIGLNINEELYELTSLNRLHEQINRLNNLPVAANNCHHHKQFIQSLQKLYNKALIDIATKQIAGRINLADDPTVKLVRNTVSLLENLRCDAGSQKQDVDAILNYKKECDKQTPYIKNFLQTITGITIASIVYIATLGLHVFMKPTFSEVVKSSVNIPLEESIKNRLLFRPASSILHCSTKIEKTAKQFVEPSLTSPGFFSLKKNKAENTIQGKLYNYTMAAKT